jgi:hypothetical protein
MRDRTQEWAPRGNLHDLREDFYRGHPIVPILGSGLSIGAGIPVGTQITHYLRRVAQLLDAGGSQLRERLRTQGWPSGHELDPELAGSWLSGRSGGPSPDTRQRPSAAQAFASTAGAEHPGMREQRRLEEFRKLLHFKPRHLATYLGSRLRQSPVASALPVMPEWIRLLESITGGQQGLVDSFFDGLVRGRTPATAHQFVAYLTRRLGTPLIFTTNFDDLIEGALLDEGLAPVVYEIVKGAAPDASLVKRHLSIIKLHGGKFELLAGKALASPHHPSNLATYAKYAPHTGQILVLGQREEPRVTSLVQELLALNPMRRVTWVYHAPSQPDGPELPSALQGKVRAVPCTDARLFLQELYQRLFWSHPAGQRPYRALFQVPEVIARSGVTGRAVTRTQLSFNLYEFASFPAFLGSWTEQLKRHLHFLPPLMLSPSVAFRRFGTAERPSLQSIWVRHIAESLRRHPFEITIDLLSAFSSRHPAHRFRGEPDALSTLQDEQIAAFARFIEALQEERLGDSLVSLLASKLESKEASPAEKYLRIRLSRLRADAIVLEDAQRSRDRGTDAEKWAAELIARLIESAKASEATNESAAQRESVEEAVIQARWRLAITRVACGFRRPRPFVALIRLACYNHEHGVDPRDPHARAIGQIEDALAWLVRNEVLLEPEWSGTYSMIEARRNALFEEFRRRDPLLTNEIQHEIAQYYRCDLYEQSNDCAALVEYFFHRLASADVPDTEPSHAERRRERLAWLLGAIARERLDFVGRGQASVLLDVFEYLEWTLHSDSQGGTKESRRLRDRARELKAEVLKDSLDIGSCRAIYLEELSDRDEQRTRSGDTKAATASAPGWPASQFVDELRVVEVLVALAECGTVATDPNTHSESVLGQRPFSKLQAESQAHWAKALELLEQLESGQWLAENGGKLETAFAFARAADPFAGRLAALRARMVACQIELTHMGNHAWEDSLDGCAGLLPREVVASHGKLFNRAIDNLAEHPNGEGVEEIRCRLRCSYARTLYLSGLWRAADKELNRALAFNTKRHNPESVLSRVIYQLHRAEYAMLRARDEEDMASVFALLNASLASLTQGKQLLERSRCNVLWWGRLFILTARANTEMLRILLGADHLQRRYFDDVPSALDLSGRYRWKHIRAHALQTSVPENVRYPGPLVLDCEMLVASALSAICGGLNNSLGESMHATVDQVWDELWVLWSAVHRHGVPDALSPHDASSRWTRLNHCAGLGWYEHERAGRYVVGPKPAGTFAVGTVTLADGARAAVLDVNERGVALDIERAVGTEVTMALSLLDLDASKPPGAAVPLGPISGRVIFSNGQKTGVLFSPEKSAARKQLRRLLEALFFQKRIALRQRISPSMHRGSDVASRDLDSKG